MRPDDELDPAKLKKIGGRKPEHAPEDLLKLLPADGLSNADFEAKANGQGISRRTYYRLRKSLEAEGKLQPDSVTGNWKAVLTE